MGNLQWEPDQQWDVYSDSGKPTVGAKPTVGRVLGQWETYSVSQPYTGTCLGTVVNLQWEPNLQWDMSCARAQSTVGAKPTL